jgi:hypothetical protein
MSTAATGSTRNIVSNNRCEGLNSDFGVAFFNVFTTGQSVTKNIAVNNRVTQHNAYGILFYDNATVPTDTWNQANGNYIENIQGLSGGNGAYGAGIYCVGNGGSSFVGNTIVNCCVTTTLSTLTPAGIGINGGGAAANMAPYTVTGNSIMDMAQGNVSGATISGIFLRGVSNGGVVSGNTVNQKVTGGLANGIYAFACNNIEVSGNLVNILNTIAGTVGIFAYANGLSMSAIGIDNNTITGCSSASIEITQNGGFTLTNVTCNDNKVSGGASGSIGILASAFIQGSIIGNTVNTTAANALNFSNNTKTAVSGNTFTTSSGVGVLVGGTNTGSVFSDSNYVSGFPGSYSNSGTGMVSSFYASAIPAAGTFAVGDRVTQSSPTAGAVYMWICTVAGTGGGTATFKTISNS